MKRFPIFLLLLSIAGLATAQDYFIETTGDTVYCELVFVSDAKIGYMRENRAVVLNRWSVLEVFIEDSSSVDIHTNKSNDFQEDSFGIELALHAIERLIRSQGEKFTPNSLEVNEEFVAYSKERQKTNWWSYYGGSSTVNESNAIYYDMIEEVKFLKKKKHYEVRILSKATRKWKIFFCWDRIIAKEGADGFAYMRTNFRKLEPPNEDSNGGSSKYDDLEKLHKLLESGIINQEEFDSEKKKVLSQPY